MRDSDQALAALARQLGSGLQERGGMLVAAESCTGGWVAKVATDIAGSSAWFDRGFVTYSNEAKQELLGVAADTLLRHGAVSAAVVAEMAQGALARSRASLAVAISGVAGPGGGSPDKPVGTVWFAWSQRDGGTRTESRHFSGDREAVRRAAVARALEGCVQATLLGTIDAEGNLT